MDMYPQEKYSFSKMLKISSCLLACMLCFSMQAQQPKPIDRIDRFEGIRAIGYNLLVLDTMIIGSGLLTRDSFPQGLYYASYNSDGLPSSYEYHYDSLQGSAYLPTESHELFYVGNDTVFACISNTASAQYCYTYDLGDHEFVGLDTTEYKYGSRFYGLWNLAQYDDDLYALGLIKDLDDDDPISPRKLGVLHYGQDTSLTVFGEEAVHLTGIAIFATGEDEWFVLANRDNDIELYRKVNGEVRLVRQILSNNPYFTASARTGTYVPDIGIFLVCYATPTGKPSRALAMVDTLGVEQWRLSLEDYISVHEIFHRGIRTFIKNMIPSADGDGIVFAGAEYIQESDTLEYAYGIVGKVDYDGNMQWLRRYRHVVGDKYENQFQDLALDGYGGYMLYGTVDYAYLDPWSHSAWLVRVDAEGLLIDTSTSTVEVTTLVDRLQVYPNPSSGEFFLKGDTYPTTLQVYTMLGELLAEVDTKGGTVDLSVLPAGKYVLKGRREGVLYTTVVVVGG